MCIPQTGVSWVPGMDPSGVVAVCCVSQYECHSWAQAVQSDLLIDSQGWDENNFTVYMGSMGTEQGCWCSALWASFIAADDDQHKRTSIKTTSINNCFAASVLFCHFSSLADEVHPLPALRLWLIAQASGAERLDQRRFHRSAQTASSLSGSLIAN